MWSCADTSREQQLKRTKLLVEIEVLKSWIAVSVCSLDWDAGLQSYKYWNHTPPPHKPSTVMTTQTIYSDDHTRAGWESFCYIEVHSFSARDCSFCAPSTVPQTMMCLRIISSHDTISLLNKTRGQKTVGRDFCERMRTSLGYEPLKMQSSCRVPVVPVILQLLSFTLWGTWSYFLLCLLSS